MFDIGLKICYYTRSSRQTRGFVLKRPSKNFLPKKFFERVALTQNLSHIKPKVSKRFKRLTNIPSKIALISLILIFFSGYFPAFTFPPVKSSHVYAQDQDLQKDEVIASSFPQSVMLPHPGFLSNKFSSWHPGVDIATELGMPIHPITSGVVEEVNFGFWGYGNHVIISHPQGFKSLYGHMGKIYAQKGQAVRSEDIIGEVGLSGFTSGPHTHLEVTHDGNYINPLTILPEIPDMPGGNIAKR